MYDCFLIIYNIWFIWFCILFWIAPISKLVKPFNHQCFAICFLFHGMERWFFKISYCIKKNIKIIFNKTAMIIKLIQNIYSFNVFVKITNFTCLCICTSRRNSCHFWICSRRRMWEWRFASALWNLLLSKWRLFRLNALWRIWAMDWKIVWEDGLEPVFSLVHVACWGCSSLWRRKNKTNKKPTGVCSVNLLIDSLTVRDESWNWSNASMLTYYWPTDQLSPEPLSICHFR